MSYTALYRKFRPQNFEDVKGQEHIVTTLKNQIKNDRLSHAYLFTGTRGTGKTTIAKIFARAVNCENPVDGSPCGKCAMCQSILEGSSMNVIEMDAASNNGVDNIRQIVDEVTYSPTLGKYKVYIIDEVHMLSTGAFNALLKTLEEPPSYVIFILATTEVHKIPITILSRCQRYDFRRMTMDNVSDQIKKLTQIENVAIEDKAVRYIAKVADGSMRDGLSLLDQCIAFYLGEELTYDKVLDVLGAVDTEVFSEMLRQIIKGDVTACLKILEKIVIQGRELGQFISDMTWYLRNLLLIKTAPSNEEIIDLSTENMARLKEEANDVSHEVIMRYIRILSELSSSLKFATQKRILVEVALIKLCTPQMETDNGSLVDRVRQMEEKLANGIQVIPTQNDSRAISQTDTVSESTARAITKALPEDIKAIVSKWGQIVAYDGLLSQYLRDSYPSIEGESTLMIVFRETFSYERFKTTERLNEIKEMIAEATGKEVNVAVSLEGADNVSKDVFPDIRTMVDEQIDFEIDEIDDNGLEEDDFEPEDYDE